MKSTAQYTLSDTETESEAEDNDDILLDDVDPVKISTGNQQVSAKICASSAKVCIEKKKRERKTEKRSPRKKTEKPRKEEIVKQPKPAEFLKLISVAIDSSLLNHKFGSDLLATLRTSDIRYNVKQQPLASSITWTIEICPSEQKFIENYIIFIWTSEDFTRHIAEGNLSSEVMQKIKCSNSKATFVIFGIEEYFRKTKASSNRVKNSNSANKECNKKNSCVVSLGKMEVEMAVGELQLSNVQYKFIETGEDLGLYVAQFTKALSELPVKLERNKRLECTEWFALGDSRECVRVDIAGHGLMNLWQQQICQFPNVTLDIAQAIVSNYSSPQALIKAYDLCPSRKEAELLLQNIPVRRTQGPLTSVRKVGPELSKKMYQFFCGEDGNSLIS